MESWCMRMLDYKGMLVLFAVDSVKLHLTVLLSAIYCHVVPGGYSGFQATGMIGGFFWV